MSGDTYVVTGEVYDGGVSSDAVNRKISLNRQRALRVAQANMPAYEMAQRGQVFRAAVGGSGIAPGTALGTSAQALCLYNPVGSNIYASLLDLAWAYVSGTWGLGFWTLSSYSTLNPTTNVAPGGTAVTPSRSDGAVVPGKIQVFSAATLTAAGILCEIFDWFGVVDGTGATQVGASRKYPRDGSDIIMPGTALIFTYVGGAGTTPKTAVSAKWAELPILSST